MKDRTIGYYHPFRSVVDNTQCAVIFTGFGTKSQILDHVALEEKGGDVLSFSTTDCETTDVHRPKAMDSTYPDLSYALRDAKSGESSMVTLRAMILAMQTAADILGKDAIATISVAKDRPVFVHGKTEDGVDVTTAVMPWVKG